MAEQTKVNRSYKDRLFRFIFNDRKELLTLYNAINGTDYQNPDDLVINTMEDVIYMGMKNDLSFLIYGILNLYEQQSTWNPNMPLRNLIYVTDLLKGYVEENQYDIYGSRQIMLPTPQAIVFYNGRKEEPERRVLKLSDSFKIRGEESCMEFQTIVLNINYGKNQKLMEKCRRLRDYSIFTAKVREYQSKEKSMEQAVERAIKECIREDVLSDILIKHRSEVTNVILEEYDAQAHLENEKRWSYEEGIQQGIEQGIERGRSEGQKAGAERKLIELVCKKMKKGKSDIVIAEELEEDYDTIAVICRAAKKLQAYDMNQIYEILHAKE